MLHLLFALASCCLRGISPSIQCFLAEFHFQPLRAIGYTAQSVKDNVLRWISLSTVENVDLPWPLLTHRLCGIAIRHRQCSMVKRVIPEIMLGQSKFSLDILLSKLSRLRELPRLCTFESMLSSVSKPLVLETSHPLFSWLACKRPYLSGTWAQISPLVQPSLITKKNQFHSELFL